MTGLELCRRIAEAVIAAYESENIGPFLRVDRPDHQHAPTLAVLATLEAAGAALAIAEGGDPETMRGQIDLFELHDRR